MRCVDWKVVEVVALGWDICTTCAFYQVAIILCTLSPTRNNARVLQPAAPVTSRTAWRRSSVSGCNSHAGLIARSADLGTAEPLFQHWSRV
ncbi:hypothetical protein EJ03DRAFT_15253 [Teratosphaeria nubilosa]|uniref:Uncharacterized protein n=1 Tax=Teratosphaeria nubilosa TaxID=161662 RepID=A0A6G1KVW7_9PEZI|nr:hypothetical protein EJ03DRAFT_15253 [Teratosphaeria nubilosa]